MMDARLITHANNMVNWIEFERVHFSLLIILYIIRKSHKFKFQQQVAYFELPRVRSSNFEFPQVRHGTSVWNYEFLLWIWFFCKRRIAKRVFWVPKLDNFLKHPGTSENVPELPQHTRNFPNTPGTSQTHPELPKHTRRTSQTHPELPKHTRNFLKTPGTSSNVPGTSQNTRGTSEHPGNFPKTPG